MSDTRSVNPSDAGVAIHARLSLGLPLEALEEIRIPQGQGLDGHLGSGLEIRGEVHGAHSARAEEALDLKARDGGAHFPGFGAPPGELSERVVEFCLIQEASREELSGERASLLAPPEAHALEGLAEEERVDSTREV